MNIIQQEDSSFRYATFGMTSISEVGAAETTTALIEPSLFPLFPLKHTSSFRLKGEN